MANLIGEHEVVVLTEDVPSEDTLFDDKPKEDLRAGARGTIVDVHTDPPGYTVEFTTEQAEPSGGSYPYRHHLVDLRPDQVRPVREDERSPVRA